MGARVLIVDDEPLICRSLSEIIRRVGYETHTANDGYQALEEIKRDQFSAIVTDVKMPGMDGLELLKRTKELLPNIAVIVITGYATVDSAVNAMKIGAYDYISKPFTHSKIKSILDSAIIQYSSNVEIAHKRYRSDGQKIYNLPSHNIITSDPQMSDILKKIEHIAQTDSTVLICGESGTGKELIAKTIHEYSKRSQGPFVAFNCAALPESLIESELFGHEKGAFTGAVIRRIGKFEMAHQGTILLDEVSEMAMPLQAKLLRVIQDREICRLGGNNSMKVDTRIIATTNKDLSGAVDKGEFREDLFYRLFVIPIFLPPLRERKDDIPILAKAFMQRFCHIMGKEEMAISDDAINILMEHSWPGNVRELENTIERAVALSPKNTIPKNTISPEELFLNFRRKQSRHIFLQIGTSLENAEREIIAKTLEETGGNKQKAAEILGITSKTIRSKLKLVH